MQGTPPFIRSKSYHHVSKNCLSPHSHGQAADLRRHYKFIVTSKYKSMMLCEYKLIVMCSYKCKLPE